MDEYISRQSIQKRMDNITNDPTCPLHIAAEIDQCIDLEPAADVVPRREFVAQIISAIDDRLHEMAMEYANAGHMAYFAVCEMVHHKVLNKVFREYSQEHSETVDALLAGASGRVVSKDDNGKDNSSIQLID